MMKKTIIAALLPLAFFTSHHAFAEDEVTPPAPITVNGGTVQFGGSIVNAPCAIDTGAAGLSVDMGQYRVSDFATTGDVSGLTPFNIALSNCAAETYTRAAVTFSGSTATGNNKALSVNGGAGGVGIQILQNHTPLAVDGSAASTPASLNEGSNMLTFQAQYISLANAVTPGAANATANFTVTYQ